MDSTCVIREVAKGVWTFSCPFARFGLFPVGGRSTAVRLQNGDVWVLASTPLTEDTKMTLRELGPVKWIIGADAVHHMFLGEFKKEWPDAKLIAVKEAADLKAKEGLKVDGTWGSDPPDTKYGFEDDIKHCYFSGFKNKDVAFFHPASKTMMEADLLFNLPPTEQYSKTGSSGRIPLIGGLLHPFASMHKRFAWTLGVDKEAMKRDVKTVAGWDFERIIPCHGDVIEKDAKAAWCEAYKWYLD
ncbi:uncharacterized protein LAESUDRAFT_724492 [Laetiporus sulphureus 93-53]|uniref:Metallo-beta-lactamase domain-containing protein n=1 Tax=Laetiporus sulphureus 93-53 TaxID=1314785 RepID=A0A165EZ40_9APHY|nr:uncharacterized protein LAESUDRAFT_724492 [Laetiporus sulphureus 93-53]KZT08018.1 hypothetical protein LAESUDRAFT_724492 [Laetiporus sulphureus 93-53]